MTGRRGVWLLGVVALAVTGAQNAAANTSPQTLPFVQTWTNTAQITANDDWSTVPGIEGFLGQDLTTSTGTDPQTILTGASSIGGDRSVVANQTDTSIPNGDVAEFHSTSQGLPDSLNSTVALQASNAADAPHLIVTISTAGITTGVGVSYSIRDIDCTTDDAVQQVALQYRLGTSGSFTNIPAGYVPDATSGPSLCTLVTPKSVALPSAVNNQAAVQLRIITSNVAGVDEWVGVDDITVVEADAAPFVTSTAPSNGATGIATTQNVSITFSEPVNVAGTWFTISCGTSGGHTASVTGGPTTFTLDPSPDFATNETCTVTVDDAAVTDQDTADPPNTMAADFVFSFSTSPPAQPPTPIHDIQGAAQRSPMEGLLLSVTGIVTAKRSSGFYVQEPDAEADGQPATSEGIFVATPSMPTVSVGDAVTVMGTVTELRPGGPSSTDLTTTELTSPTVSVDSSGNPLPTATVIGVGGRTPPVEVFEDDSSPDIEAGNTFDPAGDGLDFFESLEGMLVQVNDPRVVGPTVAARGELPVLADNSVGTTITTPRGGIVVRPWDLNPERIVLDDEVLLFGGGSMPAAGVFDHFAAAVVGVVDYSLGNFKVEVTSAPTIVPGGLAHEVTGTPPANKISIATLNVANLDPGDGAAKFNALAALVVDNLRAPDIIELEEVQDDNGPTNDSVTSASTTYSMLIAAINALDSELAYQVRQIDPVDDQDGGPAGGNIRVAFLYRTDRGTTFVDKPGAGPTTPNTVSGTGLQYSPGRIDPGNAAFAGSRKPLAAEFMWNGTIKLFLIANHFNERTGDQPLFGRFQPPARPSQAQRIQQAQVVNGFADAILSNVPGAQIVVLGDFNDHGFSTTLTTVAGNDLVHLSNEAPIAQRYTYVSEDGNGEALDHVLVSYAAYRDPVYDIVHVNSEFASRISDHDPQILQFNPQGQPTAAELAGFSARRSGKGVVLRWRTATETRIAGFDVYRQRAGRLVKLNRTLIRAKAPGRAVGRSYALRVPSAAAGARYRLRAVRLDGSRAWLASARAR